MRRVLAVWRLAALLLGLLVLVPLHLPARLFGSMICVRLWNAWACTVLSLEIVEHGAPVRDVGKPIVYVSNHLSYFDIMVLGRRLQAMFIAKSEVASWPLFGYLAKLANTIFIVRRREAINDARRDIGAELRRGNNVILFGEGTSTDGRAVKPFRPALFEMFYEDRIDALIQPIAMVIEQADGKSPDAQPVRDLYAWWRLEDDLAPHLWTYVQSHGARIAVYYLPPVEPAAYAGRHELAEALTAMVAAKLP